MGQLTNLWSLPLQRNQLSGPIPAELGNLSDLYLSGNQFSGCIPRRLYRKKINDFPELRLPYCDYY